MGGRYGVGTSQYFTRNTVLRCVHTLRIITSEVHAASDRTWGTAGRNWKGVAYMDVQLAYRIPCSRLCRLGFKPVKGKVIPRTGHEFPKGQLSRYSDSLRAGGDRISVVWGGGGVLPYLSRPSLLYNCYRVFPWGKAGEA